MHIIHPATYKRRREPRRWHSWPYVVVTLFLILGLGNYLRPLPVGTIQLALPALPSASNPALAWPATGQAAVAADGYGVLASSGSQTPIATASVAKVITALCVLSKLPLESNQSGPSFTVTSADINIYNNYIGQNASLIPVALGETLTERQALEALMLPSANNIADSLASWVFTNQAQYATYATQFLAEHGITHTQIGNDASGFDASTTSTAGDLSILGLLALQNPTLMAIAGQKSTQLPVVGTVYNYDTVLGQNGITGLKTGNSTADPGAFLFTASAMVGSQTIKTVGAVLGQADLTQALTMAVGLAGSIGSGFSDSTVLTHGQAMGQLYTAWGTHTPVVTTKDIRLLHWKSTPLHERHSLHPTSGGMGTVGVLQVTAGSTGSDTPLVVNQAAAPPSFWWRLSRH